uniref:Peptidase A2 domain-containing protein n=1 Tax=Magallana gigas TaxID=29159 RepID=A0A8W8MJN8_MAGGI
MGVVLSQGTLFGQSQVNHALVSQAGINSGQSKGHYPVGNLCIVMGARPSLRYLRLLFLRWGAHMRVGIPLEPKATQVFWQATVWSGRNVPAEAKCLQYTGSLELGLFYAKFRTLARYYGWNDDDCLLALSVSVEGPALKEVRMVSVSRQSQGLGCTSGGKVIPSGRGVSTSGKGKRYRWSGRCFKKGMYEEVFRVLGCDYAKGAWQLPVEVNDVPVSAVVDTAAEITIVAQSIHDQMSPRPEIISSKDVSLAGGGETMMVGSLADVLVEIGGTHVRHHVYFAPLQVDMLLGIGFLHENDVDVNCSTGNLRVGASKVPMFKVATEPCLCLMLNTPCNDLLQSHVPLFFS